MKNFEDLTVEQRRIAVTTAVQELKKNIRSGLLLTEKELSDEEILSLAMVAAEESTYTDDGKIEFELDEDVPSYFLGGCL